MAGLNIQYDEQGRIITPKATTTATLKTTKYKPQQFEVSDLPLVGSLFPKSNVINQPETVQGSQQEKLGGMIQQNILKNQQPTKGLTTQPTTGPTTGATGTGGAVAPAFYANPQQVEAVGTAASLGAPIGTSGISTAVKRKGLFEQTGDWFSKLPADKQESALKAMTAAGFNLMQTGGTTYRTPISNAALLGQAGTVGLKTYEADQAAKAQAASEAAKLKFDQEYKTAKLGLTGGRGRGGATSGVDYKKVAAYVTKESDKAFKIGDKNAKAQFDKAQPGQIITDSTTGIQHTKDKNGVHQVIHPDLGIPLDQGAYQSNLQTKGINELYPELGGTGWGSKAFAAGRNIPQPYQTMHNGVKGIYDPNTKMFTPL